MTRTFRIHNVWVMMMALVGASLCDARQAEGKAMSQSLATIDHIVEQVRSSQHLDRSLVEKLVHVPLHKTLEATYFETYEAKDVQLSGLSLDAELREPIPGSGATGGAILTLRITHGCPSKADVEARYKPWTVANIPRGGSLDEETAWVRREAWGEYAFGFAERHPDCLSSVTFTAKGGADGG